MPDLGLRGVAARRLLLAYGAVICLLFAAISGVVEETQSNETGAPPPAASSAADAFVEALEALQNTEALGELAIEGETCIELDPEMNKLLRRESGDASVRIEALFAANDARQAEQLAEEIVLGAHAIVRQVAAVQVATLHLGLRDRPAAQAWLARAPSADETPPCFAADMEYLRGRIALQDGRFDDARTRFAGAIERNPLHIPAHLERVRIGLRASRLDASVLDAIASLRILAKARGARQFATDLALSIGRSPCAHEGCFYLDAAMLHWANQRTAAEAALDRLAVYCATAPCDPSVLAAADSFRIRLASEIGAGK